MKYVTKGTDKQIYALENSDKDEIMNYQTARYIGSSEASWRIFEFPIHEKISGNSDIISPFRKWTEGIFQH